MDMAHFELLDIKIPSNGYNFYDDGYVDSVSEITRLFCTLLGEKVPSWTNKNELFGLCRQFGKDIRIFYLDMGSKFGNSWIRTHEELHAIDRMGGLEYFEEKLYDNQNVGINMKRVKGREVRANLGSIYYINSIDERYWKKLRDSNFRKQDNNYQAAKKLYEESKFFCCKALAA